MRLEYLAEGSPDCPLIRLSHFSATEAFSLASAVAMLGSGKTDRVAIHELPGVAAFEECELVLVSHAWDQAIIRVGASSFECRFTTGTWDNLAGLIEPFASGVGGYQWLAEVPGEARLLLSATGEW